MAAEFGRECARWSTEAATHIQHLLACRELAQFRKGPRCRKRAAVKVVDSMHILVPQLTADIGACRFHAASTDPRKPPPGDWL